MIFHDSHKLEYRNPFGAAVVSSSVHLRIDADEAKEVLVRLWTDEEKEKMLQMNETSKGIFEVDVKLPDYTTVLWYFFVVNLNDKTICYGNNQAEYGGEGEIYEGCEPHSFQITVYKEYESPKWYKDAVVYQIFPDRFFDSPLAHVSIEEKLSRKIEDWNTDPYYIRNDDGSIKEWNFWGGNLAGVSYKLPYLSLLGVTCIYLNPIFTADSNHRYDTSDYFNVDPLLGTNEDFVKLCEDAKFLNIRIILDGVFSHTGINSKYFKEHPDWYTGNYWWGVKNLPEVDENNPEFTELICGENGALKHWLRLGASGFRLDVADELPDEFIKKVRKAIKDENKDAVLIGEVWEDASNKISYGQRRKFILGEELDGVMNYPLRGYIIDFLNGNIDAYEFTKKVYSMHENYPKEAFYSNFNLLGSHDRERIKNIFGFNENKVRMAAILTFILPGVPVIYYGDEIGLTGGADPDNRKTFPWGKEETPLHDFYAKIANEYPLQSVLKNGDFKMYALSNDELVASRTFEGNSLEFSMNRGTLKCNIRSNKA